MHLLKRSLGKTSGIVLKRDAWILQSYVPSMFNLLSNFVDTIRIPLKWGDLIFTA